MPALDLESSHEYWKNYQDPMIYRVVQMMETMENWTVDGNPDIEAGMTEFGDLLENTEKFSLSNEKELMIVAANLKATRFLRILQAIDQAEPGSASRLLMHAEQNSLQSDDIPGLFLRRNIVFERLRLLGRVFSPERFTQLTKALEGDIRE